MQLLFKWLIVLIGLCAFFLLQSCEKTTDYPEPLLSDYMPLKSGSYHIYQVDSLIYTNFGTRDTLRRYQVKYEIDSLLRDNINRPAYRIFRYIRKTPAQSWQPQGTSWAILDENQFEWVEQNLRFIKLRRPIVNGFQWKGNAYIDTYSSNSLLRYMDNWLYTYDSVGLPLTLGSLNFDNTLTIQQRDEIIGVPEDPSGYHEINQSREKYAKGVGLIYRIFFHKEYQPNNGGYVADGSYGIEMTLLEHR
jgi:hypothetical protein